MRHIIIAIILTLYSFHSDAQLPTRPNLFDNDSLRTGEWLILYDSLDVKVAVEDSAFVYCLLSFDKGKPNKKMHCYYMNGIKQWDGKMLSIDPDIKHGNSTFYYPLGNVQQEVNYINNVASGEIKLYFDNGQLQYQGLMKDNKNTGYWEYYHTNGNLQAKGDFLNGKKNGFWKFFFENGQLQAKGLIKNEEYQGKWVFYYESGQVSTISNLVDNLRNGSHIQYFENGVMSQKGSYKNNLRDGHWQYFHDNSNLESEGKIVKGLFQGKWDYYITDGSKSSLKFYKNDVENGFTQYYHSNGKLASEGEMVNGLYEGAWVFYYESGQKKLSRIFKDNKDNGLWVFYAENGTVTEKGNMLNDTKDGDWIFHFLNGKLSSKGTYKNDLKNGYFEFYREDGTAIKKGTYYGKVKEGDFEFYFENGELNSTGKFKNDQREGLWAYYHDNGNLSTEGLFVDGKSEGNWKYYYADGTLKKEGDEHLDKRNGFWKYYYESGAKKSEGVFENSQRNGLWKYYFTNGNLETSGNTKNDDAVGIWHFYDSLGRKRSNGKWTNNLKDSIWTYYDTLGRLREVGAYVNNKADGKWWIYVKGKKDHKEYWDRGTELNFWNLRDSAENVASRRDFKLAFKITKVAKKYWKKTYKPYEINYHNYWRMMGIVNRHAAKYDESLKHHKRALQEVKRIEKDTSWNYAISLNDLGILYSDMGLNKQSLEYYEKALPIIAQSKEGKSDNNYFHSMTRLARSYLDNNQAEKGINLLQSDIQFRLEYEPQQINNIASAYAGLAELYYNNSMHEATLNEYKQYFKYLKEKSIENHPLESKAYRLIGYAHNSLGNDDSTIFYLNKAISHHRSQNDTSSNAFALSYSNLATKHYGKQEYVISKLYADSAIYIAENNNLTNFSGYIDALMGTAKASIGLYQCQEAISQYQRAIKIINAKPTLDIDLLSTCYQGMAVCEEELYTDDLSIAEKSYQQAINVHGIPAEFNSDYSNSILLLSGFYSKNKRYNDATKQLEILERYFKKLNNPSLYQYGRVMEEFGKLSYRQYKFDSAKYYFRKALTYYGDKDDFEVLKYAAILDDLADIEEDLYQYNAAQKLILEALNLLEEKLGKIHPNYVNQLFALANHHDKRGNHQNAIVLFKQVLESKEKIYGKATYAYVEVLRFLGFSYKSNEQYDEAMNVAKEMQKNILRYADKSHEDYLDYLKMIADVYKDQNNFKEAKYYFGEWLSLAKKLYGTDHEDYAYYLRQTGSMYKKFGKNETALPYLLSAVNILANTLGTQNQNYAWSLEILGELYYSLENYKEALSANQQIITIYKNVYGEESNNYIDAKSSLANLNFNLGRYADAELQYQEALSLTESFKGKYSYKYEDILEDMCDMYQWWNKPEIALEYAEIAMSILDSLEDTQESRYYYLYNVMGSIMIDLGRLDESESFYIKARDGALKIWGKTGAYYTYINNLSFVYLEREEYARSEKMLLEAGDRFKTKEVINDLELVNYEDNLAALYLAWGKMDLAEKYWTNVTSTLLKRINSNFTYMSESEKANFWSAYNKDFEYFNSYAVKAAASNPKAIGQMYDNQLQTKSILLSSSTKERTKIINSGDTLLINKYYDYISIKENLSKYYGYTKEQLVADNIKIDSIESLANDYEKQLSLNANALADEEKAKKVRWKNIQRKLKDNEAAVEIIRFRHFHKHVTDSVIYAALILTSDTRKSPELVILPNGNELEKKYIKNYLTSIKFKVEDRYSYDNFWKQIDAKLKGKSVVYFSPDGVFNQLNVNTFARTDGTYILDDYNVYILTSTKDVLLLDKEVKATLDNQTAVLFGFPKYDLEHSSIESLVQERALERSRTLERDIDLTRFGFAELPGTKKETQSISDILVANQWQSELYLADEALEEVLKAVSSPNVLHIATHGFFLDDVEGDNKLQLGVSTDRSRKNPLLRSGLLLAGAAQTVQGDYANKTENGIFTAYEAMNLDLTDTELVVLSACETGRGEVKSGEGVYGLQRAFQVAGAETLIMSLWKVNDDATQLLMTNFYQNWLSGLSKNEAFKKAQMTVREQFHEPYYWGAFVMVGG